MHYLKIILRHVTLEQFSIFVFVILFLIVIFIFMVVFNKRKKVHIRTMLLTFAGFWLTAGLLTAIIESAIIEYPERLPRPGENSSKWIKSVKCPRLEYYWENQLPYLLIWPGAIMLNVRGQLEKEK